MYRLEQFDLLGNQSQCKYNSYECRLPIDLDNIVNVPQMLADGQTPARGLLHCRLYFHEDGYSEVADSLTVHRYFGNEHGKLDKAVTLKGIKATAGARAAIEAAGGKLED